MTADTTEPFVDPPYYPHGGTYADLLCWHMDYWGTRPTGNTVVNGKPWGEEEFRQKAFGSGWEERTVYNGMRNWRGKGSAPEPVTAALIEKALFGAEGENPAFDTWRSDLRRFHQDSRGPGKNKRTQYFPHPPPPPPKIPLRHSIPGLTPHFIGRESDLETVVSMMMSSPGGAAVLIQGGPGMGKTELTKAVARHPHIVKQFGDRRWFVPLATTESAEKMKDAIALIVGCDPRLGFEATLNSLRGKQTLLVLDNLETPWERTEERNQTEATLAELCAVAGVSVLASFRGLDLVDGVAWQSVKVDAFSPQTSKDLFEAIAGKWVINDRHLDNFTRALGGIPLAIRLVARRAHSRTNLAPLWREWKRVGVDFAKHHGLPEGPLSSLPYSIEMSLKSSRLLQKYNAIRLFSFLGYMQSGFSDEDCAALLGEHAFRAQEQLINSGIAIDNDNFIDLLPPIREHAHRYYPPNHEDGQKIISHFLSVLEKMNEETQRFQSLSRNDFINGRWQNINYVLSILLEVDEKKLYRHLDGYINICQLMGFANSSFLRCIDERAKNTDDLAKVDLLMQRAYGAYSSRDYEQSFKFARDAGQLSHALGENYREVDCMIHIANIFWINAMPEKALDVLDKCVACLNLIEYPEAVMRAELLKAICMIALGNIGDARPIIMRYEKRIGNNANITSSIESGMIMTILSDLYCAEGDIKKAMSYLIRGIDIFQQISAFQMAATGHAKIAYLYLRMEGFIKAIKHAEQAREYFAALGDKDALADTAEFIETVRQKI